MKLPRDLSGAELIKLLCKQHGYRRVNQEGSHVILQTETPQHHRIAVSDHSPPMPLGFRPHPGGIVDNSPTFQRWQRAPREP